MNTKQMQRTNRAFTLLESLLVLFVVSMLALGLSGGVGTAFRSVQETVFLWEFEHLYRESQKLAVSSQEEVVLQVGAGQLSNGYQEVAFPATVSVLEERSVVFNREGGNSSLAKVRFQLADKRVDYQLYIGSGRYKKTEE